MKMKGSSLVVTTAILCMFGLVACGTAQSGKENEAVPEENIYVTFDEQVEEYKAEDDTLLLTIKSVLPVVDITDNKEASAAINDYVKAYDVLGMSVEDAKEWAEADYKERGKDNWYGYEMETVYSSRRTDVSVISFIVEAYSYMGGAHPNGVSAGLNFNPKTGKRLTLADVTVDEQAAAAGIREFILEETKRMEAENEGMFFEGYEESIGDILTEDTWYLAEDGMHIIANEYIISPHAAGILDFIIPYEKADFLKEEYR